MRVYDVEQGSPEWLALRAGIVTASRASDILTPKTMKPSEGRAYMLDLLEEWITGRPKETGESAFTRRGSLMESQAREWYEFDRGVVCELKGFITTDDGTLGYSPDSLIGDDGLAEFKVPALSTHIGYMLDPQRLVDEYRGQCRTGLVVTERKWCDLVSWHPVLSPVVFRFDRDPAWESAFASARAQFGARLADAKARLAAEREAFRAAELANPMSDAAHEAAREAAERVA